MAENRAAEAYTDLNKLPLLSFSELR